MLTMRSIKIVAFVEGTMERNFLNQNFPYAHVITLQNGDSWSVERLCEQIESKFKVYGGNPDIVVVWLDREHRIETASAMKQKLRDNLKDRKLCGCKIAVCVTDRMSENMILADSELIKAEFGIDDYSYIGDGHNGKSFLKQLYKNVSKNYRETVHGIHLLKKIRLSKAALESIFVKEFLDELTLDCWWI
jgi:hypothetical protein